MAALKSVPLLSGRTFAWSEFTLILSQIGLLCEEHTQVAALVHTETNAKFCKVGRRRLTGIVRDCRRVCAANGNLGWHSHWCIVTCI